MIIWIASYPKSGNTWIGSFIISLLYSKNNKFHLNNLERIEQYPSRKYFRHYTEDYFNLHEIKKFWISSQDKINLQKKITFFKTHNSLCNLDNYYFTNFKNSLGAIYIVRDPRNVITSVKNHYSYRSYDEAKEFLFDENAILGISDSKSKKKYFNDNEIITPLSSWKTHYNSWKLFNKNFILIKYEELIENTFFEFKRLCNYLENILKIKISNTQIKKAIDNCSFYSLKNMEEKEGFAESTFNKGTGIRNKFFNLGPKNDWRQILDEKIIEQIEKKFKSEMSELKYL